MTDSAPLCPTLEVFHRGRPGRLYPIQGDDFRIGRIPGIDVYLDDTLVSRDHARVERRPDGTYLIEDLGSHNGTYLDGQKLPPFQLTPLLDGTRIKVADFALVFHRHAVQLRQDREDESSVVGSFEDLSSSHLASRSAHPEAALRAILAFNRVLGGGAELDDVLGRALDGLIAVFAPAECGFILTTEPDGGLLTRAIRHGQEVDHPPTLSRTVLGHVLREGKAVLIVDATMDERFKDSDSLFDAGIRTALCVPLTDHGGRTIGLVQLDGRACKGGFTEEDLNLLAALAVPVGVFVENHRLLKERASGAAAREIQAALLPRRRPRVAGYSFWEYYRPAQDVGGDLYDYIPVEPVGEGAGGEVSRWAVTIGDVAGKGMPAALLMAGFCPEVRHLARVGIGLEEVLARVNRHVYDAGVEGRFVTMAVAELDAREHTLRVFNAGHMDPLVRRADGSVEVVGREGAGTPLGALPDAEYRAVTVALEPGDVVVLSTDGVIDALAPDGRRLGEERLFWALTRAPRGVAQVGETIIETVHNHSAGRPQFDDITLVCFGRDGE